MTNRITLDRGTEAGDVDQFLGGWLANREAAVRFEFQQAVPLEESRGFSNGSPAGSESSCQFRFAQPVCRQELSVQYLIAYMGGDLSNETGLTRLVLGARHYAKTRCW